jgi:hypothetical protein
MTKPARRTMWRKWSPIWGFLLLNISVGVMLRIMFLMNKVSLFRMHIFGSAP